jgi:hypothetical protein
VLINDSFTGYFDNTIDVKPTGSVEKWLGSSLKHGMKLFILNRIFPHFDFDKGDLGFVRKRA